MIDHPRFIIIDQAAERLSVSPQTVRRWIEEGRVPSIRVGMSIRIPERWFDKLEQQALAEKRGENPA